jgi:hypothetical protein
MNDSADDTAEVLLCLRSYLQRREWAVSAVRLAWLLHFAGALAPQGGTPAAAAVAAPSSFRELAVLAHLSCADALLVMSLLFPVSDDQPFICSVHCPAPNLQQLALPGSFGCPPCS